MAPDPPAPPLAALWVTLGALALATAGVRVAIAFLFPDASGTSVFGAHDLYSATVVGLVLAPAVVAVGLARHTGVAEAARGLPLGGRYRAVTFLSCSVLAFTLECFSLLTIDELASPAVEAARIAMSAVATGAGVSPIILLYALRRQRRVALMLSIDPARGGAIRWVAADVFMGLRMKSLLLTICAAGVVMMALRWSTEDSLSHSFERLEVEDGLERAGAGRNAVLAMADGLRTRAADWAIWDDTYAYVVDRNAEYAAENAQADPLRVLEVDGIVWLDTDAKIVTAAVLSADHSQLVPPPSAMKLLDWRRLAALVDDTQDRGGVVDIGGRPFVVGICPILKAQRLGPRRGTLIMFRAIDDAATAELTRRVGMPVLFQHTDELRAAFTVAPVDDERLASQFALPDVFGAVHTVGTVISPRRIAIAGREALRAHSLEIAAAGIGFALFTFLVLSRLVVAPVRRLGAAVDAVRSTRDASVRVPVEGTDEVGRLADGINAMLWGLDETSRSLHASKMLAEAANSAKATFLANMSHEIRTPMTAILGYTDLIVMECDRMGDSPQLHTYAKTIKRNGDHLLAIINDILDVSKIEAGKMTVESLTVDLAELIAEVVTLMRIRVQEKGITLDVERSPDLPAHVSTDPVRLRQILINLLGNAVKFTEAGGVTLRVGMTATPSGERGVEFQIVDTGVGMAPEYLGKLFGAFEQADATMTRRFGGTGLGLRVSRSLARLLGGDITVSSEPGRGSIFTVVIAAGAVDGLAPVRITSPELAAIDDRTLAGASRTPLAGRRIFLAEDGLDNQRLIAFYLRKAGAEVRVFDNGRLALESLTVDGTTGGDLPDIAPCDLLLTDMQMPEMDGYTLTETLRARGYRGPIGALTAHAMDGDSARCLAAGCDFYLTKPINKSQLTAACAGILEASPVPASEAAP